MTKLETAMNYFINHIEAFNNENCMNGIPSFVLNDRKRLVKIANEVLVRADYYTLDIGCIVVLPDGKVYEVEDIDGCEETWIIKNRDTREVIEGDIDIEFDFFNVDFDRFDEILYKILKND